MPNYNSRRGGIPTPPSSTAHRYGSTNLSGYGQARKNYYEPVTYAAPQPVIYVPPMHYSNMANPPPGLPSYGPIAAPTVVTDRNIDPKAQNHVRRREHEHEQRRNQRPAAKQEKVVGGVAQELDYEMDQMTDYVAEMAQEIVMPRSNVSPPFRKFISQILSSTRLPSSTILLGLNYLAKRMSMLNTPSPYKSTEGQVWRMVTIALLLGSKFLDDNTFQNRSWSEVSGIPVAELNTLETEWLLAIDFRLHVDPVTDSDFHLWLGSWANWKETKNQQRAATLDRLAPLAPIDTNIQRQPSQRKNYSSPTRYDNFGQPVSAHQSTYSTQSRYEQSWSASASEMSPPSAPESGPNTPEWMMLPPGAGMPPDNWYGYDTFYTRRHQPSSSQVQYAPAQPAPYHTPFHNQYSQGVWTGHPAGCGCAYCCRPNESYFMHSGYGQQTVAG